MKQYYLIILPFLCISSSPSFASENRANDNLISLSSTGQASILGKIVGDGCKGKTAFYMGSMDEIKHEEPKPGDLPPLSGHDHDAYWSLRCRDGRSYVVTVFPDGNGGVLECAMLKFMHAGQCFKKFEEQ